MNTTTFSAFMIDFAGSDSRSVKASLGGRDDGRTARYFAIAERMFAPGQDMAQQDLIYTVGDAMDSMEAQMEALVTKEQKRSFVGTVAHEAMEFVRGARQGLMIAGVFMVGFSVVTCLVGLLVR